MSERIDNVQPTLEQLREALEREKVQLTRNFIQATDKFLLKDDEFNGLTLKVFNLVVEALQRSPGTVFRSGKGDLDEVIAELKKQAERINDLGNPGVKGGAIDWIDDLERIVKALSGVVKEEKDFFLQIIKLIFCGC